MRILVNHLTRMTSPRICIAGIDLDADQHVRPVTGPDSPLTRSLLRSDGGAFEYGAEVDIGNATPQPDPPETEDHRFEPRRARFVRRLDSDEFLERVDAHCEDDLESIFGPALERQDWNYAVEPHTGEVSLGCLRVQERPELAVNDYGRLILRLNDPDKPAYIPVNDLRFYAPDHRTIDQAMVADVSERIRKGVSVRVMVGLARAWPEDHPLHWLQVNGICLEDKPVGDEP